jgi:hypothetical protein
LESFVQPSRLTANFDGSDAVPSPSGFDTSWMSISVVLPYGFLVMEEEVGTFRRSVEPCDKVDHFIVKGANITFAGR